MIKTAKKSEAIKEFKEADQIYHEALMHLYNYSKDGNSDPLEISQVRAYLFDSMADMAMKEGNFKKAEVLYKEVMTELLTKQNFKQDDNALIEISLKLAMIYAEQADVKMADMGYMYCLDSLEGKMKDGDGKEINVDTNTLALYGICLDSFANFLYSRNKLTEALPFFEKALSISEEVLGGSHTQVCVIHNSIGVILSALNKHQEALEHLYKAIEVGEVCESADLGVYYLNLAEVNRHLGQTQEASINLKRARIASAQQPDQKTTIDKIDDALKKFNTK